jgi:hypothetical protein
MTPQSSFMIVAPVADGKVDELRRLLQSMNLKPGVVDPSAELVPFGAFDRLHVARFVVLEAPTSGDIAVYGVAPEPWPTSLVFLGDIDDDRDSFLEELASRAGDGLRTIFAYCEGFDPRDDLVGWMKRHERPSSANYINWIGRTVRQVHEEQKLHAALVKELYKGNGPDPDELPSAVRDRLAQFVKAQIDAGTLTLTKPEPTPPRWRVRNMLHAIAVPLVLVLIAPLLILASPFLIYMLRRREKSDPDTAPIPERAHVRATADLEDYQFTNQFTVFGDLKPGHFRLWVTMFLLWVLNWSARHIYSRGYLTRVQTIHFARWVFLDHRKRLFFASNYDGSVESYMDDFINKVAWGLNLVFSNGVGYPSTRYLLKGGAEHEDKFKRYLRNRQQPTDVWYKAYPGLTAFDLAENGRIRDGLEHRPISARAMRHWLSRL